MDFFVTPGGTISGAVANAVSLGMTHAVICVEPSTTGVGVLCPGGQYFDNVSVPPGLGVEVHFRERTCVLGVSTTDPVFEFDGSSPSELRDFQSIACPLGSAAPAGVLVRNATLAVAGVPPDPTRSSPMGIVACDAQDAILVDTDAVVDSMSVSYQESRVGIHVSGWGTMFGGTTGGGTMTSTMDEVQGNFHGLFVEANGELSMHRNVVFGNQFVGEADDNGVLVSTDTRYTNNASPNCPTPGTSRGAYAPTLGLGPRDASGFGAHGNSRAEFLNNRWIQNCTHQDSDLGLIRAYDDATLVVRNNTIDNNETSHAIQAAQTGPLATTELLDNIVSDSTGAYGGGVPFEIGIQCATAAGVTIDSNVFYQLDLNLAGPCTSTNDVVGNPHFIDFSSPTLLRRYHLHHGVPSIAIDTSTRTIGTAGDLFSSPPFTSSSYGTAPRDPDPGLPYWLPDSGPVDAGWHWWSP